jgi:hypothetical protein
LKTNRSFISAFGLMQKGLASTRDAAGAGNHHQSQDMNLITYGW